MFVVSCFVILCFVVVVWIVLCVFSIIIIVFAFFRFCGFVFGCVCLFYGLVRCDVVFVVALLFVLVFDCALCLNCFVVGLLFNLNCCFVFVASWFVLCLRCGFSFFVLF